MVGLLSEKHSRVNHGLKDPQNKQKYLTYTLTYTLNLYDENLASRLRET